jgi:tetratricopeptide (TPR) repeat protein
MFGRELDVQYLLSRVRYAGITALSGRPLMGKTWTVAATIRKVLEEGGYCVGYHEATGGESSHLLYTVANLYSHWLADSTMRAQALRLWEDYKHDLVPRAGQLVGTLFEKLLGVVAPEGVRSLVRMAFDGLASMQQKLISGDLQLPVLAYDEALSFTRLVAKMSGRRILLVLDAWEKMAALSQERSTLESILKHPDDWDHVHLLLIVRNPQVDSSQMDDQAHRQAMDLCRISNAAQLYELPMMDRSDTLEQRRMLDFVRERVPSARDRTDAELAEKIDGYPGVLNFWSTPTNRSTQRTWNDICREAHDAHALRYIELGHLLRALPADSLQVAARLAFLPRLDQNTWPIFRDIVLGDTTAAALTNLIDGGVVVSDDGFPTYGHDTRHVAAQRWFGEHQRPLLRRCAEFCTEATAALITGDKRLSIHYVEILNGCATAGRQAGVGPMARCLLDAAQAALAKPETDWSRDLDDHYAAAVKRNPLLAPLIAVALYNRGVHCFERGDHARAIDYYTWVIELPGASAEDLTKAFFNRAYSKGLLGDIQGEIADYTEALNVPSVSGEFLARPLYSRAVKLGESGDIDGAEAGYTAVLAMPDAPALQWAKAHGNRGVIYLRRGDFALAQSDFGAVIEMASAPLPQLVKSFGNRGLCKREQGDLAGAVADYTSGINITGGPAEFVPLLFNDRGRVKVMQGDFAGAIADFSSVLTSPDADTELVAVAHYNRAFAKQPSGDLDGAILDLTATIELAGASEEIVNAARVELDSIQLNIATPLTSTPRSPTA